MNFEEIITQAVIESVRELYRSEIGPESVTLQKTKKEFEGDFTLVVFPFLKMSRCKPDETARQLGEKLMEKLPFVEKFNVIKGFLNLSIRDAEWIAFVRQEAVNGAFGHRKAAEDAQPVLIEFSSPNTNKPLHLGHVRNNLLGDSVSRILEADGNRVIKVNLVNDRGIHICKSMIAWLKYGNGETPESSGMKGDHLVGKYYVEFDKHYKAEMKELMEKGMSEEEAGKQAPILLEAQAMLRKWEEGDTEVRTLWEKMNRWVYEGFDSTYQRMGIAFNKIYYESNTYLLGKEIVKEGLDKKVFYRHSDGSVRIDLQADGLDEKVLLRSDGTSVYMTQDLGTALTRYNEYHPSRMIYVVGNEQNYHFQVLSILLDKLGFEWGKGLVHFSYGMVELPNGKMKSREGTVVDADDLVAAMIADARATMDAAGKNDDMTEEEKQETARIVGMGALKYFLLKVDARKNMLFNPEESIDFNGNTGPFIQYTYARIRSVLRKAAEQGLNVEAGLPANVEISTKEEELIQHMAQFAEVVRTAGQDYSPSVIANYCYDLVKEYNQFYHDFSILKEEDEAKKMFRLVLSKNVAKVVRLGMGLLGIEMPERM